MPFSGLSELHRKTDRSRLPATYSASQDTHPVPECFGCDLFHPHVTWLAQLQVFDRRSNNSPAWQVM